MASTSDQIKGYIAQHDIQSHMQGALQYVCDQLSPTPWLTISKYFADLHEAEAKKAYDDATDGDGEEAMAKARLPLGEIFMQFDADSDGFLDMNEFQRALRAIGLPKREGEDKLLDEFTFKQMDSNGDGKLSVEEFDTNIPIALRAKLEAKLDAGWKFDEEKWKASQERHKTWNMAKVFKEFDSESKGSLTLSELKRAFRAVGLKKRTGEKLEMDETMFKAFDTNGDGVVSLQEFEANVPAAVRAKIVEKLDGGWKYDPALWSASHERHAKVNFTKIFKDFDSDSDGHLDFREMQRAFRAIGLKKRAGSNYELDAMTFKAFDANGDGKVSLEEFQSNMPEALREKLVEIVEGGWKFDQAKWDESMARHAGDEAFDSSKAFANGEPIESKYPLAEIFLQFDADSDGFLDIGEFQRALRAMGMEKREGDKADLDEFTFKQMDKNGDGKLSVEEFDANVPLALRAKIEAKLAEGWKFDEEKWKASQERHKNWNMAKVFAKFDVDNDGFLSMVEFQRGFRALGLKKRSGEDYDIDQKMFTSFDTNGDGKVSLQEFQDNLHEATRKKLEEKLDGGWKFDPDMWKASQDRHTKPNYAKIFKKFDSESKGKLDLRELQRGFRAMGFKKRDGTKYEVDKMTFDSFDANKDGVISLEEFEKNMPEALRAKLNEVIAGGWEFDEEKWAESMKRHANDEAFDRSKAYG